MAENPREQKEDRENREERLKRLRALLQERGEDAAKMVKTWLQQENGKERR